MKEASKAPLEDRCSTVLVENLRQAHSGLVCVNRRAADELRLSGSRWLWAGRSGVVLCGLRHAQRAAGHLFKAGIPARQPSSPLAPAGHPLHSQRIEPRAILCKRQAWHEARGIELALECAIGCREQLDAITLLDHCRWRCAKAGGSQAGLAGVNSSTRQRGVGQPARLLLMVRHSHRARCGTGQVGRNGSTCAYHRQNCPTRRSRRHF